MKCNVLHLYIVVYSEAVNTSVSSVKYTDMVLSTDLAEWHQEAMQHWYLGIQQCHRGTHLVWCVSVCVRTSVGSTPGTTTADSSDSHIYTNAHTRRD